MEAFAIIGLHSICILPATQSLIVLGTVEASRPFWIISCVHAASKSSKMKVSTFGEVIFSVI